MDYEKVYQMPFAKVYPLLVNKALRKGRTQAEVDEIIAWLTGTKPSSFRSFWRGRLHTAISSGMLLLRIRIG